MLILASISGIQDYLFDVRETGGGQARSLRNRSFRIQLIAECVALRLLQAAGVAYERLMFSAAGKVSIDAHDIADAGLRSVQAAAADIERRLLDETHGRLRLAIALEHGAGSFAERFERASQALAANKLRPFAAAASRGDGTWPTASLVVRQAWDAEAEAERDAELGRRLVQARWLTIRGSQGTEEGVRTDTLGFRVCLDAHEPTAVDGLVSCSNLAEPESAPRSTEARRHFHVRRLARHVPCDKNGQPIEFVELAARARGAPMLGVLKADADSLGVAVSAALHRSEGGEPAALRQLSHSLDRFFTEILGTEMSAAEARWNSIYTVFSGGDDLLAVGPWDVVLDFAGHMRACFHARFGPDAADCPSPMPLTISAGVAIIKPKYPIHLAAAQSDELLDLAKGAPAPGATAPKDQCAALGQVWKWRDHDAIIGAGKQLADWVDADVIQRGWLHALLNLALLRRGHAGPEYAGVPPAVATSRLAYHVARNWPQMWRQPRDDRQRARNAARAWIDAIVREFDRFETTTHVDTIHLPAILRYALLATRSGGREEIP